MGKKGKEIVELDVAELIRDLQRAVADEWSAAYQYWVTAEIIEGLNAPLVEEELKKSVKQEIEHADELADRIIELGGRPPTNPDQWEKTRNCKYFEPPEDPSNLRQVIQSVLEAEACAIEAYNKLAKKTFQKDHVTYDLITHILSEEVRHEEDFENLLAKL